MPANQVPVALAFAAGLVATINPCGFAMLPSFLSYYLGAGSDHPPSGRVAEGLTVGLVAAAGFLVVFGAVGAVFGLGLRSVVRVVPWATIAIGVALMGLGVWLLSGRHLAIRLPGMAAPRGPDLRSMFLFGMAYAVGSLSCTLPVFMVVMGAGLAAGSLVGTVAVFLAYGLGMSTVLMLLCLGTAGFRELVLRKVRPLFPHLGRISGLLLLLGGGYVVYYWVTLLGGRQTAPIRAMQRLQGWVQQLLLRPGERVWLLVGLGLLVAAVALLFRWARRTSTLPEDADEESGEPRREEPVRARTP